MAKVTVEWVAEQVAQIEMQADDVEVAHGHEDVLYRTVLEEIAGGSYSIKAKALAAEALRTQEILRDRWYA